MKTTQTASLATPAPLLWAGLILVLSIGTAFAFACGAPFAAMAALAAINLRRGEGLIAVLAAWFANQAIGYGLLSYPVDAMSLIWGAVMGAAMVAAYLAARLTAFAQPSIIVVVSAFAVAFGVFQGIIYAFAWVVGGTEAFTMEAVGWVLAVNAMAYTGMTALHFALRLLYERPSNSVAQAA